MQRDEVFTIGCHLSSADGFLAMGENAVKIGANTFQFFTRNPRGGAVKPLDMEDIETYKQFAAKNGISQIVAHAPYTLNACAEKIYIRDFALKAFTEDLSRLEHIPGSMYNFHPGNHVGQGKELGTDLITELLNKVLKEKQLTIVLLETMAGKGSEIGSRFEELQTIIENVKRNKYLGACLDTCHVFDAGYDIVNDLDGVLQQFDKIIGLDRLKAIHLNDSMNEIAKHKDRHEKIGKGKIGLPAIEKIINHSDLKHLPFLLETPHENLQGYEEEIKLLKSLRKPN